MSRMHDSSNYENHLFLLSVQAIAGDTLDRIRYFDWFEALSVSEARAHLPLEILTHYLKQAANTKMFINLLCQNDVAASLHALIDLHWEGNNEMMRAWIKSIITAIDASTESTSHTPKAA